MRFNFKPQFIVLQILNLQFPPAIFSGFFTFKSILPIGTIQRVHMKNINNRTFMMQNFAKKLLASVTLAGAATGATASTVTAVDTGHNFSYAIMGDLWGDWTNVNLATFDNFAMANPISSWATGQSAFGNYMGLPQNTRWESHVGDLALFSTFTFADANAVTALTLDVASDNGFAIFLNDQLLAKDNQEYYTTYWEYTFSVPASYLMTGSNTLKVLAEDHGGKSFFDMRLTADIPAPGAAALIGLSGLLIRRRRA